MSDLGRALLEQLDRNDLEQLAELLAPHLTATTASDDRWLTTAEAALHLGLSVHALHRLTAARRVPFTQHAPGGRCYFRRSELDAWRAEQ
jgi:excisionase family DNA binding protein